MRICVIDGQGGGIGSAVVRRIKEEFNEYFEIWALGTNAIATSQMMKARANKGATGESAIVISVKLSDIIIGPISIILANSMMGEITPTISSSIASCNAKKFLLPLTQEYIEIIGVVYEPLPHHIDEIVKVKLKQYLF